MSDDTATLFDWDSGLVDDVDFSIDSARFTYNSKIRNGEVLVLALTGNYTDENGEGAELEQFYACGEGWEPVDGGNTARREDGRSKLFNARSGVVEFINAAVAAGVTKQEIVDGGGPTSAKWLAGRTFHMNQKEFSGTFDGEKKTWFKFLPTKVVNVNGKGSKGAKAAAKIAEPPAAAASTDDSEGVPAALKAKLTKLAKSCESHDEFIDRAFAEFESEVSGNAAAEGLVVDSAFFDGLQ